MRGLNPSDIFIEKVVSIKDSKQGIRTSKVYNIYGEYEEDMDKAYGWSSEDYVLVFDSIKEALDYVYQLYDEINNK